MNENISETIAISGSPENVVAAAPGKTAFDCDQGVLWVKRFGAGAQGWVTSIPSDVQSLYSMASPITATGTNPVTMLGTGNGPVTVDLNGLVPGDTLQFATTGNINFDPSEGSAADATIVVVASNGSSSTSLLQITVPLIATNNPFSSPGNLVYTGNGIFYGQLTSNATSNNPTFGFCTALDPNAGPWTFDLTIQMPDSLGTNNYTPTSAGVIKLDSPSVVSFLD